MSIKTAVGLALGRIDEKLLHSQKEVKFNRGERKKEEEIILNSNFEEDLKEELNIGMSHGMILQTTWFLFWNISRI